jgi:hypothetical protein
MNPIYAAGLMMIALALAAIVIEHYERKRQDRAINEA